MTRRRRLPWLGMQSLQPCSPYQYVAVAAAVPQTQWQPPRIPEVGVASRCDDLAMDGADGAIDQHGEYSAITRPLPPIRSSLGTLLWQLCLDKGPQLLTVEHVGDRMRSMVYAYKQSCCVTRKLTAACRLAAAAAQETPASLELHLRCSRPACRPRHLAVAQPAGCSTRPPTGCR